MVKLLSLFLIFLTLIPASLQAADESARVYFFHALKAKEEGRFLTAERFFRKAIETEPENPDFHFELGNLYLETKNAQAARVELEQAVMARPDHVPAHFNLGLAYRELGLMREARDEFRKVLERDPSNARAQLQIGYTYQDEGFTEDAREAFQLAHEMDPASYEPQDALQGLNAYEEDAQRNRQTDMMNTMNRNRQFLYQPQNSLNQEPQADSKGALLQAGMLLAQQLLAKKSQSSSENTG